MSYTTLTDLNVLCFVLCDSVLPLVTYIIVRASVEYSGQNIVSDSNNHRMASEFPNLMYLGQVKI